MDRLLSGSTPTAAVCDVVLRLEPAEGGLRVAGADGGAGVVPAEGGGEVTPASGRASDVGARAVAPASFNPNLDVTPRRVSFDLAFDPRLLGGTAVTNPSVGRVDYDIESGVFRLDGRVIGVASDDAFRRWCASVIEGPSVVDERDGSSSQAEPTSIHEDPPA